jgi:hypothetical protein
LLQAWKSAAKVFKKGTVNYLEADWWKLYVVMSVSQKIMGHDPFESGKEMLAGLSIYFDAIRDLIKGKSLLFGLG